MKACQSTGTQDMCSPLYVMMCEFFLKKICILHNVNKKTTKQVLVNSQGLETCWAPHICEVFQFLLHFILLTSIFKLDTQLWLKNNQPKACQTTGAWDTPSVSYMWVFLNFICILAYFQVRYMMLMKKQPNKGLSIHRGSRHPKPLMYVSILAY